MEYIRKGNEKVCIFCSLPARKKVEESLVLHKGRYSFAVLNRYPYNNAHVMVAPYRHTTDLLKLTEPERQSLITLVGHSSRIISHAYGVHGLNVGYNLGRPAGAGYAHHLHFHLVPRWIGDTNFMPILGDTKVVSQSLLDSFRILRPGFQGLEGV